MAELIQLAIGISMGCVGIGMALATLRLLRGPTAQDRVLALDSLYLSGMVLVLLLGMRFGTRLYLEIALLVALVGFVSSIALAKFLLRGEVIE